MNTPGTLIDSTAGPTSSRAGPHESRLRRSEPAVAGPRRVAGSWCSAASLSVVVAAGGAAAVAYDGRADAVGVLGLFLSGLALLEVSIVLMATRRAARAAVDDARQHADQARRMGAAADELRADVQRLHTDLARITAQTERSQYQYSASTAAPAATARSAPAGGRR